MQQWPAAEQRRLDAATQSLFDLAAWKSLAAYRALPDGATLQTLQVLFAAALEQLNSFHTSVHKDEASLVKALAHEASMKAEGSVLSARQGSVHVAQQRGHVALTYRLERKRCLIALMRVVAILAAAHGEDAAVEHMQRLRSGVD